ncbi:hypothetical protein SAMN05428948_1796 [Massilia sp. CF038]|nr:hypothetical protein SAMN05428948_1796 [Massilia sp. CF038]
MKVALLTLAVPAAAYETGTHKQLTLHAADRSVLATNPSVLSDLGFMPWTSATYNRGTPLAPAESTRDVIAFGATNEDDIYNTRALNHFYDPQANNLQGRPLTILGVKLGNASPDFILEDRGLQADAHGGTLNCGLPCPQEFSYRKGQQALLRSLTAASKVERDKAMYLVFQNIGHVVHHVQDMGQPAHTRNDQHLHPVPFLNTYPDWASYELYTLDHSADVELALRDYAYPKPVVLPTARHFWQSPGTVPMYVGMAEFTSNNFTSFGTQYAGYDNIKPASGFPLPSGANRYLKEMFVGKPVVYPDGVWRDRNTIYVAGTVWDGYSGLQSEELPLAARSLLTEFPIVTTFFIENSEVWKAGYKVLMPRASAFSTGMINHFFRGKIDIAPGATANSWTIKNAGTQAMKGTVAIYAEDANGNRTPLPNGSAYQDLAPGASVTMNATAPANTSKIVAAFRGQIGEDGDPQSDYFAVAGKVISYANDPEIVIVGHSYYSGAPNTQQIAFRWSSKSGVRALPVGAGGIFNEAFGISPDGKTVVGTTWGLVEYTGATVEEFRYILDPSLIPDRSYNTWRAVAVKWNINGDSPSAATYLNAGKNYSAAWRTSNGGERVDGEGKLPQGGVVPVIWNKNLAVSFPPALTPRNSLTSADGSITLSTVANKAVYTQNGVVKAIPMLRGHDISVATHVVIVK